VLNAARIPSKADSRKEVRAGAVYYVEGQGGYLSPADVVWLEFFHKPGLLRPAFGLAWQMVGLDEAKTRRLKAAQLESPGHETALRKALLDCCNLVEWSHSERLAYPISKND
jgi:hypothetical protein